MSILGQFLVMCAGVAVLVAGVMATGTTPAGLLVAICLAGVFGAVLTWVADR